MHIEADLLSACRPSFVAKAISMFSVVACVEAMVAGGNSFLVHDVHVRRVNNLEEHYVNMGFVQKLKPVA